MAGTAPCQGQAFLRGELIRVGQPSVAATLTEIRSVDEWLTAEGPLDVASVVRLGNPQLIQEDSVVVLDDGSTLVATELRTSGRTLQAFNKLWDEMALPLRPIRGILLRAHLDPDETQAAIDRIFAYGGAQDQLLLANGDSIEGTLRRLTPLNVEFQIGGRSLSLERKRVSEIRFAGTLRAGRGEREGVWVGLSDGSLLLAQQLKLADDRLTLQTPTGIHLRSSSLENAFQFVTYLRPVDSTVTWLSGLDSIGFKSLGFLSADWDFQKDRNVRGGTLKSHGYVSQKGLGLHATSRIAYRVPNQAARFRAKVGVDDDTQGLGSVIFRVYTSQTGSDWNPVYESPVVRGGDAPVEVDVPLEGAKGLALVVEYADGADVMDHANWLDARFEPQ